MTSDSQEVPEATPTTTTVGNAAVPSDEVAVQKESLGEVRVPNCKLLFLLCAVGCLEGADMVLLPCVFYALQVDLGLSLNDLALMSLVQAVATNLAAPAWGVMADRGIMRRKSLIVLGCVVQGLITVILSVVDDLKPMVVLRAFNGIMLASLRPIANGIVADVTSDCYRGKVFGSMQFAMNVGTMGGTLVGTNLARHNVLGLQGWRVAFIIVGLASVLVGVMTSIFMEEPPKESCKEEDEDKDKEQGKRVGRWQATKAEALKLVSYFRTPSFCVLILQGCFGSVPWNALGYSTLFFQIGGLTDLQASIIQVFQQIAGSLGSLLGGVVSDRLTLWSRFHGRPLTAQISVLAGIPVAWFIFMQQPPSWSFWYYLLLMITLGLTATWCGIGVNLPILSEIVKPGNRATIIAWEGALEGSCSAIFGNAMVGFLAENVFGYHLEGARERTDIHDDPENVHALGSALMLVSFCPWIICFLAYSFLHWSYPHDLRRLERSGRHELPAKTGKDTESNEEEFTKGSSPHRPRIQEAASRAVVVGAAA